jgi:hypothetical protein
MDSTLHAPRLLTRVRQVIRLHQYSRRTEEAYVGWIRRYVRFSGMPAGNGRGSISFRPAAGIWSRRLGGGTVTICMNRWCSAR